MEWQEPSPIILGAQTNSCQELKLIGEVSVCHSADLHRECLRIAGQGQDVIVNCQEAVSFDTAALQILTALKETLGAQRRKLTFSGISRELAETIDLAGLKQHLAISDIELS